MEYFKSGLKSVLGAQQGLQQLTGAEIVERLVERVQTSTLLDDRRDACRALKSLSKKFRLEVGAQGMDALIKILEEDKADSEIMGYSLNALCNVISGPPDDEDFVEEKKETEDLGGQFTEIYIKKQENITLLIDLLEEYDFRVRWPAVKLLTGLLLHRTKEIQEVILVSPMGVSRLMDLLAETREVIRNDTLLLLAHLTRGNANIQKIVAFENAFDRLIEIIKEEGYSDGGVVVEDCLVVLLHLLKNNISNQNFFKEGSYIHRLTLFFSVQGDPSNLNKGWSAQKVTNIHFMLQIVRTLVSPNNPLQLTASCQKVMYQCGLLEQLCNILMASGVPADILTETINAVAEVIRGHHGNQEYFVAVNAPSNPPRSAIVVLLMSMVNEKQPFVLRCAVLYCFQCFLYRNELGQAQFIQTLLPSSADISTMTAGQLLCGGLFSSDSLSIWFAAVALSHALVDNPTQKEQLLRVQLATNVGNPPVSLITQCTSILQQGSKAQTRLGLLMLLCTWLSYCSLAVTHFLSIPTNIPFLTSQVGLAEGDEHEDLVQGLCAFLLGICVEFNDDSVPSFTREDLSQLIIKRIGLETFLDKLGMISKQESYGHAAQKPQMKYRHPSEVFFDFEFCRLFKILEGIIIKAVQPKPKELVNGPEASMTVEQHSLLLQYKSVIREQDQRLSALYQQLETLKEEKTLSDTELQETNSTVQKLRDQNALLKAQKTLSSGGEGDLNSQKEMDHIKKEFKDLQQQHEILQNELREKTKCLERLRHSEGETGKELLQTGSVELQEKVDQQSTEIGLLKHNIIALEKEVEMLRKQNANHENLSEELRKVTEERNFIQEELDSVRKEQEDLLVLLTEQDSKLSLYRQRLQELGVKVNDEDDLDVSEDAGSGDDVEN